VRKHARASAVMVSLHCDHDSVIVTVQDNGVGLTEPLDLEADDSDLHFGVATMHQLTAQAQGEFFIANNDDQGVMVKARFPVPGACTP
jgi:signal transduction histidine kinase